VGGIVGGDTIYSGLCSKTYKKIFVPIKEREN